MKNRSASSLSLLYSSIIAGVILIILSLSDIVFELDVKLGIVAITSLICFIVSFLILRYLLFSFIYNRIRLIYKTIRSSKRGGSDNGVKIDYGLDLIKQVENDVTTWAVEQEKEIEKMRVMNNYRKEFVGNVSHELKTPIFNIQGYTLTLLEGGLEDKNINQRYLQKIEKNITRMITIVNDLDSITKLESGQLRLRNTEFDPIELCTDIIESLEDYHNEKVAKMEIVKHYDKTIIVNADKDFMSQVFSNLLINAIHYNDESCHIKVEFFEMDTNILVEVTDNGVGIAEEDLSRIFERFYRVDKSRSLNSGGSGLGLSIVKHIIEAHGQTVNIRSTVGVGTTIAFTITKA